MIIPSFHPNHSIQLSNIDQWIIVDWLKGKNTGKPNDLHGKNDGFLQIPLNQSIELWIFEHNPGTTFGSATRPPLRANGRGPSSESAQPLGWSPAT